MINLSQDVIIIGATGLVGKSVVKALNLSPHCQKIRVVVRRENEEFKKLQKVEQIILDDFFLLNLQHLQDCTHAISCLGTTIKKAGSKQKFYEIDYEINLHFAKLLQNTQIHYGLISALGANATSPIFYNRVKGELEESIQQLNLHRVSIFQPSLLLGQRNEQRLMEDLGQSIFRKLANVLPKRFKYAPVEAEQLAHTMVEALSNQTEKLKIYDNLAIHTTK